MAPMSRKRVWGYCLIFLGTVLVMWLRWGGIIERLETITERLLVFIPWFTAGFILYAVGLRLITRG